MNTAIVFFVIMSFVSVILVALGHARNNRIYWLLGSFVIWFLSQAAYQSGYAQIKASYGYQKEVDLVFWIWPVAGLAWASLLVRLIPINWAPLFDALGRFFRWVSVLLTPLRVTNLPWKWYVFGVGLFAYTTGNIYYFAGQRTKTLDMAVPLSVVPIALFVLVVIPALIEIWHYLTGWPVPYFSYVRWQWMPYPNLRPLDRPLFVDPGCRDRPDLQGEPMESFLSHWSTTLMSFWGIMSTLAAGTSIWLIIEFRGPWYLVPSILCVYVIVYHILDLPRVNMVWTLLSNGDVYYRRQTFRDLIPNLQFYNSIRNITGLSLGEGVLSRLFKYAESIQGMERGVDRTISLKAIPFPTANALTFGRDAAIALGVPQTWLVGLQFLTPAEKDKLARRAKRLILAASRTWEVINPAWLEQWFPERIVNWNYPIEYWVVQKGVELDRNAHRLFQLFWWMATAYEQFLAIYQQTADINQAMDTMIAYLQDANAPDFIQAAVRGTDRNGGLSPLAEFWYESSIEAITTGYGLLGSWSHKKLLEDQAAALLQQSITLGFVPWNHEPDDAIFLRNVEFDN